MRVFSIVFISLVATSLTACVLLPQKLTLGAGVDERWRSSGYNASLSWDLQPKKVHEEYITDTGGVAMPDAP